MASVSRVPNKCQNLNSFSEKSIESQFQCGSLPLVGWSDENALLMLAKKLQQPVRSTQGQHSKSERPFHHRLIKPCKEFKFYHYDDPKAYIIQYRRDCSSVSTNSASNGPLEMFMTATKIGSKNSDEKDVEKQERSLEHPDDASGVFQLATTDLVNMETNRDKANGLSTTIRLAPITGGPGTNSLPHPLHSPEADTQETEESTLIARRNTGTKTLHSAPRSAGERSYQHTQSLTLADHTRRENLLKAGKKTASCVGLQKNKTLEAKLSVNLPTSVWIGSNHYWNQSASIRCVGGVNRASSGVIRSRGNKPGKILATRKKSNPLFFNCKQTLGLRITTSQCVRQAQVLPATQHGGIRKSSKSQCITKAPSVGEAEWIRENMRSILTKPHRVRDGTDPAFGKALFERLFKLEQEQSNTDILLQYDSTSKEVESKVQPLTAPVTVKEVDEVGDLETASNILSVTDLQSPN
ncbi:hypothetical protein D915_006935 [Fasciola hepatica]|uniref:Uncharacterized protein n=1 Tax=Fasciola hepatica TaxID=6192 RepID=A0A4E0R5M3_FASHE|nr:hypothetical protein D915_006935 [Fasciola hepatica]